MSPTTHCTGQQAAQSGPHSPLERLVGTLVSTVDPQLEFHSRKQRANFCYTTTVVSRYSHVRYCHKFDIGQTEHKGLERALYLWFTQVK